MDPKYESLMIPPDIFDIIIDKYPTLDIDSDDGSSRWHFMNTLEHAYWYIVDYVIHSIINRENFFRAFINDLYYQRKNTYVNRGWITEWENWKRKCVVSGIALVTFTSGKWKVLMVRNKNGNYPHLSTTWPGGKPDSSDNTLWDQASREFFEETGIDLSKDSHLVTHILTNSRAVSFVLVIDERDPRLRCMKLDPREIHSAWWMPIDYDDIHIMKGKKCPVHIDDGLTYMGEQPASGFRKLRRLHDISCRQDNVQKYLSMDPWTMSAGNIEQVYN